MRPKQSAVGLLITAPTAARAFGHQWAASGSPISSIHPQRRLAETPYGRKPAPFNSSSVLDPSVTDLEGQVLIAKKLAEKLMRA